MRRVWHLAQEAQLLITGPGFDLAVGGAPAGAAIPAFHVTDAEGRPLSSADLFAMPAVALLSDRGCGPCSELARELFELGDRTIDGGPLLTIVHEAEAPSEL